MFYDMTALYFQAGDEDDLRKTGFSKGGKHSHPQIYLGLLVGLGGYAIGYDIYQGDIYEGHTLICFMEQTRKKFNFDQPIVVADAGLLSNSNIKALQAQGYQYILGARLKNKSNKVKTQILSKEFKDGQLISIKKQEDIKLIIGYSSKRALKDAHNRQRGLKRLEKQLQYRKTYQSTH